MIEICCGIYSDGISAHCGGAKQIELNSALHLGGLTPSISSLVLLKKETDLKIICMVRPRGAGFCYQELEYIQMLDEAKQLLENGADGIAFGFLNLDSSIDIERSRVMIELIRSYNKDIVFHRAFDCAKDPYIAIENLINLGVTRVLTSGLNARAIDGMELLGDLQEKYGDKIEILVGGGVNAYNIQELVDRTKINNFHSSCKGWCYDPTSSTGLVNYSYAYPVHEDEFDLVSKKLVEEIISLKL